ncbi:outer membrane beta-barrel protein [Puia dinghuensis]|uniref:Collagen-binding protein n=1 Tax=Puia dinghuensis TaxID=1792502 RepID=A0A8J2XQ37_9BACT|nr:outer membrane beta-barrel protein [Puia dinghuensis]GGA90548.1 collagen-binding protein [Puia dinghuensis]
MSHKAVLLIILTFARIYCDAQSPTLSIHGTVQDSVNKQTLEDATVSLVHLPDGAVLRQTRSRKKGFVFYGLSAGHYSLVTSYLGYATDTTTLTLGHTDSTEKSIRILLHHSAKAMMEVVVRAVIPPAIVKNDTIAFNASAYPTRPNATVEDLLRKLPGIDIDKNGNVTMQGQKVDKIYLDGKEFFLNDPRTATQNLPADIVDQIEAFDSQTDRSRLTGIKENTGTKSINIRLKKNRRTGYFGKVYAGTGSGGGDGKGGVTSSYSAGGTVTNLGTNWVFGTGNANNMNNQFTGADNKTGPGAGGLQTLDNTQLNFRTNKSNRLVLTLNGGTNGARTTLDQSTQRKTLLTDSSLYENRYSNQSSHNRSYNANAFVEYNPDSFTVFNLRTLWTSQTSSANNQDTVGISTEKGNTGWLSNQGHTGNTSQSDNYLISNTVSFRRRWRLPGRTLFATVTEATSHQDQPSSIYNLVNNFDSTETLLNRTLTNQVSSQHANTDTYNAAVSYTEPLKPGHLLDLTYGLNRSVSHSDRQSYDFDSATRRYDLPDTLTTNHFINYNTIHRFSTGYNATEGKVRYQLGVTFQLSDLVNHNLTTSTSLTQRQYNWYPRASLFYNPTKSASFRLFYSANTTSPTIQQLQPLPDLTNPFLVKIGNPGLLQQLTHTLNATYANLNSRTFRNIQLSLQGDLSQHEITQATTVLSGGIQQQQYVNVNGVWHLSSNLTYGFPLGDQRKGNSSITLRGHYGRDVSIVNGSENITTGLGWGSTLKLNYHPAAKLFVEGIGSVDYTGSMYSIYPNQNTQTLAQNYSLDASYELPGALTIASNYSLQITGSQGALPGKQVALWNASIYKDFFRDRSAQLRFSAFGILNTPSNFSQSVGLNYVQTQQTNIPGRILLLSFIYRFKHFPSAPLPHPPS